MKFEVIDFDDQEYLVVSKDIIDGTEYLYLVNSKDPEDIMFKKLDSKKEYILPLDNEEEVIKVANHYNLK